MPNAAVKPFSLPYQVRVPSSGSGGGITEILPGNRISVSALGSTREIAALITRPVATLFVGGAIDPAILPDGSAYAPYPELQDALDWVATQPSGQYHINCAAQDYSNVTIPPGYTFFISGGVSAPGAAHIAVVMLTGTSGGGFPCIFQGFSIDAVDTDSDFGVDPQAVLVLLQSALVGAITNNAAIGLSVIGAGVLESANIIISVVGTGSIQTGPGGFVVMHSAELQQPITAEFMTFTDCKIPSALTTYGAGPIRLRECEADAFPYATVCTFGAPGVLELDTISAGSFIKAGGSIVNGSVVIDDVGSYTACEARSALSVGAPVWANASQCALLDGSIEALQRFLGFAQLTSSAAGDPQIVAHPGIMPVGLGALTPERAYFVSGAIVSGSPMLFFSEDDLPTFLAGAPAGSWYRQVGVSIDGTAFVHEWGPPQQVPPGFNATVDLSAAFALTTTDVYQDTGLSLLLPSAGTYLVTAQVKATLLATVGAPYATARLYDVTAGAVVSGSELFVAFSPAAGTYAINTATLTRVITVSAPSTIRLEAARRQATAWAQSDISSDSDGRTSLSYVKLAS